MNLGQYGENLAIRFLSKQGYRILERNFRAKYCEIDIIAQEEDVLVFVEVKTRISKDYGLPEEAVTSRKLRHLKRAAKYFKLLHPELPEALRIDVVAVELDCQKRVKRIELIKNV